MGALERFSGLRRPVLLDQQLAAQAQQLGLPVTLASLLEAGEGLIEPALGGQPVAGQKLEMGELGQHVGQRQPGAGGTIGLEAGEHQAPRLGEIPGGVFRTFPGTTSANWQPWKNQPWVSQKKLFSCDSSTTEPACSARASRSPRDWWRRAA